MSDEMKLKLWLFVSKYRIYFMVGEVVVLVGLGYALGKVL